jgi:hypothetical protein
MSDFNKTAGSRVDIEHICVYWGSCNIFLFYMSGAGCATLAVLALQGTLIYDIDQAVLIHQ